MPPLPGQQAEFFFYKSDLQKNVLSLGVLVIPVIPAPKRQRQEGNEVQDQPQLYNEFLSYKSYCQKGGKPIAMLLKAVSRTHNSKHLL